MSAPPRPGGEPRSAGVVAPADVIATTEPDRPSRTRNGGGVALLAGLAGAGGVIHLVATIEHANEEWRLVAFFALVGVGQLLAAWWIYTRPQDLRVLKITAVGSVAVASLWIVSRTTGLPFGPDAGEIVSVGVADTIATLQELAFAALAIAALRLTDRAHRRLAWLSTGMGTRLTHALLAATLFMAALGGHEH